jgi:hypothetical protein
MLDLINIAVLDFLAHPGAEHATRIPDDTEVELVRRELESARLSSQDRKNSENVEADDVPAKSASIF